MPSRSSRTRWTDPESFYVEAERWRRLGPLARLVLRVNNTLAGRLLIGPPLAVLGFWREEGAMLLRREPGCVRIWASHAALTALLLVWVVGVCGIPLWAYVLLYIYPGTALMLLRSYYEHRPAAEAAERSAIVEAGPLMTLLYLGNNFHALHHERPGMPWYDLPRIYRKERQRLLTENGGFLFAGYGDIVRRFLWRAKDSPAASRPGRRTRTRRTYPWLTPLWLADRACSNGWRKGLSSAPKATSSRSSGAAISPPAPTCPKRCSRIRMWWPGCTATSCTRAPTSCWPSPTTPTGRSSG